MRMVQILPGVGEQFYCENCIRDQSLVRALIRQGHDAIVVPLYLPLSREQTRSGRPVPLFYGGINVYLKEKSALFRRLPAWVTRPLDSRPLLRLVAGLSGMMEPEDLGETMLSMLRGEDGRQAGELDRLVEWLSGQADRPDVVCLSDVLLAGLARRIREALKVPVVCMLQDEDSFLDELPPSHRDRAWELLAERAADIDAFFSASRYFADLMGKRLRLPAGRVHVVRTGVPLDGYEPAPAPPEPPAIGFLSRLCEGKGLDRLVDAYVMLKTRRGFPSLRLKLAGGSTPADTGFLRGVRRRLRRAGVMDDVEFLPNVGRAERIEFLRGLTVLSVPQRWREASGIYLLEAMACGVPVVEPRHGVYPELIEATGGGRLVDSEEPEALADALEPLLRDPAQARALGARGREAVFRLYSAETMATEFARICGELPRPAGRERGGERR